MTDIAWVVHPRGAPVTRQVTIVAESEAGVKAMASLSMLPCAATDALFAVSVLAALQARGMNVFCCAAN
jgi:hypothetical protein